MDNDLFVLEPSLVHTLLASTLRFADVAAPVVPGRHKMLGPGVSGSARGAPLLCSCLIAYRRAALPLLREAAAGLLARRNASLLRQGDQEYLWIAWTYSFAHLRVMPLPEDYYCPTEALRRYYASVGTRCQAIHQHQQPSAHARQTPHRGTGSRAVTSTGSRAVTSRPPGRALDETSFRWQALRPAGRCSDPAITINRGGVRGPPWRATVHEWLPVRHTVYASDPLYDANLWMYPDLSQFGRPPRTSASSMAPANSRPLLLYWPNRTLVFADSLDLAQHIGMHSYRPTSPTFQSKLDLMRAATRALTSVDTIVFTHHFDRAQACGVRCCGMSHTAAARRFHDYRPRNVSRRSGHLVDVVGHPFVSRYYTEIVALRGFRPHSCPAHPALWRPTKPVNWRSTAQKPSGHRCPCRRPSTVEVC